MNKIVGRLALGLVATPLLFGASALAQDYSAGKKVEKQEVSRSASIGVHPKKGARTDTQTRSGAAMRDFGGKTSSLRMVVRTRDGKERTVEPSQRVLDAAIGKKAENMQRDVIGRDSRHHVEDTLEYPNITVGLLQSTNSDPELIYNCTAALIGPRIAITAAQCVYDHDLDGGWLENTMFWPAMNGEDDMPFEAPQWEEMYVLDDYISAYDGSYDSVWPYDVAIIVFSEPIGEDLGWLGYNSFEDLGAFNANLVGYGDGQQPWRQYYSSCKVAEADISELDLMHKCDADYMSVGAPIYLHDEASDAYDVMALNMGGFNGQNWALRITEPIALWIDDLNMQ
jgi:V8-like Glu-specific endopeptidase